MALAAEMRRLTQRFIDDYDNRMVTAAAIRDNTRRYLADCSHAHRNMAEEQHERLTDFINEFRGNVAAMRDGLRSSHRNMAVELNQRLNDLHAHRREMSLEHQREMADYMSNLRNNVSTVVQDLNAARQDMAREQRHRLTTGRMHLASEVNNMRRELHDDFSEAHEIWNSFRAHISESREKKGGMSHTKTAAPKKTMEKKATGDDLTTIPGIGPGRQKRLNEIGIHTFAQLADSAPERLRQALEGPEQLVSAVKVENWIQEAQKRAH